MTLGSHFRDKPALLDRRAFFHALTCRWDMSRCYLTCHSDMSQRQGTYPNDILNHFRAYPRIIRASLDISGTYPELFSMTCETSSRGTATHWLV
jgi:hypothetical protein